MHSLLADPNSDYVNANYIDVSFSVFLLLCAPFFTPPCVSVTPVFIKQRLHIARLYRNSFSRWERCTLMNLLSSFDTFCFISAIGYDPIWLHCPASLKACQTFYFSADVSFLSPESFVSKNLKRNSLSCQADSEHFAFLFNHLIDKDFQTYVSVPHKKHQFYNYLC